MFFVLEGIYWKPEDNRLKPLRVVWLKILLLFVVLMELIELRVICPGFTFPVFINELIWRGLLYVKWDDTKDLG